MEQSQTFCFSLVLSFLKATMLVSYLKNFILLLWISIGRLIGLIHVNSNKKGRFFCVRYFWVYSFTFGLTVVCLFPKAYTEVLGEVNLVEGINITLGLTISKFRDYVDFNFMVSAIWFQNFNRNKLKDLLNEILDLKSENQQIFKIEMREEFEKRRNIFCFGILLKFVKTSVFVITVIFIVDTTKVHSACFFIIVIPKLSLFVIANHYFLGVMILIFYLKMFQHLTLKAQRKLKNRSRQKLVALTNDLELCDFIDNLSVMHSKLFKIYKTFSSMHQFQMLILVLSNFFALMIDFYYIFAMTLFSTLSVLSGNGELLIAFSLFLITLRSWDIYLGLKGSNEATKLDAENQRLVSSLTSYDGDLRLKNCVSFAKFMLKIFETVFSALKTFTPTFARKNCHQHRQNIPS